MQNGRIRLLSCLFSGANIVNALARFTLVLVCAIGMRPGLVFADGAAEPIPSFYEDPGKSPNREYTSQHAREHIDPFTGKLQWHYTDVFIPGNGGFDLNVPRSYSSQGEFFPAHSAYGVGWTMHFGRVLRNANSLICDTTLFTAPARNPVLELPMVAGRSCICR